MFGPVMTSMRRVVVQLQIVRHERLIDELLDDRVAAFADLEHRLVGELRLRVAQRHGALGEIRQHVERRERRRGRLQLGELADQLIEQLVVELFLARQRAIARAEHLVLELLQLRRDVALGVLHRLAAVIVRRHAVGEAAIDLDVVALHAVVAEPQVRDAAALALARFQVEQVLIAVLADALQLVELGVVADAR